MFDAKLTFILPKFNKNSKIIANIAGNSASIFKLLQDTFKRMFTVLSQTTLRKTAERTLRATALSLALALGLTSSLNAQELEVNTGAKNQPKTQTLATSAPTPEAKDNSESIYSPFTKEEFLKGAALCEELFKKKDKATYNTCFPLVKTKAATPKLQYIIAHVYFDGIGIARDNDQGINWLYIAYKSGNIEAKKDLSIFSLNIYLFNHNLGTGRTGLKSLEDVAMAGNLEAKYYLADLKKREEFKELGVYDPKVSFAEMSKLAESTSYLPAILSTANMFISGEGTKADILAGYKLLEKAASMGSSEAYKQLSLLEEANDKVENKYKAYVHQLALTTCQNSSDNMIRLNKLEAKLTNEEIKKARLEPEANPKVCK